ncbi:MAG: outer membrane beta-barrel protein [Cytophagaceae bacterium]
MLIRSIFIFFYCLAFFNSYSQNQKLSVNIFGDIYYSADWSSPASVRRPFFLVSHSRNNHVAVNNTLINVNFTDTNFRAAVGFHSGSYAEENYAYEPVMTRFIFQAQAGIRLYEKIWLDAGVFPSYIGFESALSIENPTLTRSLTAENSPYYFSGARITRESDKLTLGVYLLNGWQRIVNDNNELALGTHIKYSLNKNWSVNSGSFIGKTGVDSLKSLRLFHDLYVAGNINDKLKLWILSDIGFQENWQTENYESWWGSTFVVQYLFNPTFRTSARYEYFSDENYSVITTGSSLPFRISGLSLNLDFFRTENICFRIEGKYYQSSIFSGSDNFSTVCSLAFKY